MAHGTVPQTRLFALDPWSIIRRVVELECPPLRQAEAMACLTQAQAFFEVGTGQGNEAARPLALYYSYLNAAKTFCLTRGTLDTLAGAKHGLTPRSHNASAYDLPDAYLQTAPSHTTTAGMAKPQVFDEMTAILKDGARVQPNTTYELGALVPQILSGHRLWVEASDQQERFFNIQSVYFRHNPADRTMWLEVELLKDDISRFGISRQDLISRSGLDDFKEIASADPTRILLQERHPLPYTGLEPLAELGLLVQRVRHSLWMTVMLIPPYRRYYLYLCPPEERTSRLPQLLSMYAVTFFFGSITRYRPDKFDDLLRGPFGPRVRDFITGQPRQFVYQLSSEMARRDVARPSIL